APSGSIRRVALSRDGTRLAYSVWAWNGPVEKQVLVARLRVWEIASSRELFRRDDRECSFNHLTFSADGRRLAATLSARHGAASGRKYRISSWDLETGRERVHLDEPNDVALAFSFSPDGRRLAVGLSAVPGLEEKGELQIWDTATGGVVRSWKLSHG